MSNKNALIPINNSKWYKIKRFLRRGRTNENTQQIINRKTEEKFENEVLVNEGNDLKDQGQLLAYGLMAGKMGADDLTDKQLDEMLVFFRGYIKDLEEELNTIHARILELRMEKER